MQFSHNLTEMFVIFNHRTIITINLKLNTVTSYRAKKQNNMEYA